MWQLFLSPFGASYQDIGAELIAASSEMILLCGRRCFNSQHGRHLLSFEKSHGLQRRILEGCKNEQRDISFA